MLQFMGLQDVRYDLATEQQVKVEWGQKSGALTQQNWWPSGQEQGMLPLSMSTEERPREETVSKWKFCKAGGEAAPVTTPAP